MRTNEEIKAIPRLRMYMPSKDQGVARFRLSSTKHTQLTRVVFSRTGGLDVAMIMFKRNKRPTVDEVEEVKRLFFYEHEQDQCEVVLHPDNDLIVVIYRQQEDSHGS